MFEKNHPLYIIFQTEIIWVFHIFLYVYPRVFILIANIIADFGFEKKTLDKTMVQINIVQ